jgi:hypothetical protein
MSDSLEPQKYIKQLDLELKEGAEGIYKEGKLEPPIIEGDPFPDTISNWSDGKAETVLRARDPNGRKFWTGMFIDDINRPHVPSSNFGSNLETPPTVIWQSPGIVEFQERGTFDRTVELYAGAVNDRCVVGQWRKKVHIQVPKEAVSDDNSNN